MRISLVILTALLVSGCSGNPKKIEASYVSALKYREYSCTDIDDEITTINERTVELDKKLRRHSYVNALTMTAGMVLGWPAMLLMTGGGSTVKAEYSQLKGERDALLRGRSTCARNEVVSKAPAVGASGTQIVSGDSRIALTPTP